ncbi:formate dehydrogenase, cytochrome b556(fdo) subunit [bacterium BMS3Abin07]|nr:formate dehydrogenase, cytochrome b556(fdo) subunit [bacterium BMS3Abin07]GBE32554.1 formate dehydrogenase, cytochrome b556(fdo) subunit [bacterium BMS3Bbin05]HDO22250.1 cytochrome C [Nitrospirota bacterium]HDZ88334.1 cytochrome C [Nitrospirota bacterium]
MNDIRDEKIRRFSNYRIIEHWVLLITFIILVLTGLSQKFYYLAVSQWFILRIGGIDSLRYVHHYTALVFLSLVTVHVIVAVSGIVFKKWRPSMVITGKDFTDAADNIKYYIGMKDHPAACDRYNYKQKFEYWVVLMGAIVMIASGLVLWFPVFATQFLPGEIIPVAKVLHSNEALLIFLIIAIWHIYNAIFSPEVFPLDTSIFTGYISRERMISEHPLELERMEGTDTGERGADIGVDGIEAKS